ncbi:hypothetical protein FRC00_005905 [Tulasnella sp. 408]|nr:hypothetical protein FRC00_005905 [Tulasnella sp. 408]
MESSQLRKTASYETTAQSSGSEKSVVVDISGWQTAVEDAKAALGKTTTLSSSLETAIGGAVDQMVDKGVILDTYSGLVTTMKEIKKLEGILGEHVSLKASSDPSTGAPEVIPTEDMTELTFLSGTTDYAIAYIPNYVAMVPEERHQTEAWSYIYLLNWSPLFLPKLKNLSKLEAQGATFESGVGGSRIKLSLIEAKRMKTGDEKLVDCLPQVIAEALVAAVPFILTNGFEWIFAILKHEPSVEGSDDWVCIKTESHVVPVMGLENGASAVAKNETLEARRVLLDMMIHWVGSL